MAFPTSLDDVYVVGVRPELGPVEKWAEYVVEARPVDASDTREGFGVQIHGLKSLDRNLNVNDRFRFQPRNSGGAVVLDTDREFP